MMTMAMVMMCVHDGLPSAVSLTEEERFEATHPLISRERIAADIGEGRNSAKAWHAWDIALREEQERRTSKFTSEIAERRYGRS
jgi:hypothetical protein